ncbi:uncharacterized protein LOC108052563 [Drosophila rhopaloa]|uniref:Uncharacterized protein LOC108052563 n=1 Tax=Drosophila rhopaloa TaxID=1041015 RepID=A0A6P4FLZ1_DRORH|nr:uncharacterized protein LOC108052563 [Drosophila rhopaloa]
MSVEGPLSNIPDDVIEYLLDQRKRERELTIEKELLKELIKKVQDIMKMLEGRDDGLPCTISAGNVYQMSTVQQVRDNLAANLSVTMVLFVKAHRKLLRIQSDLRQDYHTVLETVHNSGTTN